MAVIEKARIIDPNEGYEILDEAAKKYLGITAEEFLRRYDAGEFHEDTTPVMRVVSLIHFAR